MGPLFAPGSGSQHPRPVPLAVDWSAGKRFADSQDAISLTICVPRQSAIQHVSWPRSFLASEAGRIDWMSALYCVKQRALRGNKNAPTMERLAGRIAALCLLLLKRGM